METAPPSGGSGAISAAGGYGLSAYACSSEDHEETRSVRYPCHGVRVSFCVPACFEFRSSLFCCSSFFQCILRTLSLSRWRIFSTEHWQIYPWWR